jgi:hypothetical protein
LKEGGSFHLAISEKKELLVVFPKKPCRVGSIYSSHETDLPRTTIGACTVDFISLALPVKRVTGFGVKMISVLAWRSSRFRR